MSRGAPVLRAIASKRWTPQASSRITSSDQRSPITPRAAATEQERGAASAIVRPSMPERVDFSNPLQVGFSNRPMHTRAITLKHLPPVLVRPLRNGDVATVRAVFDRL